MFLKDGRKRGDLSTSGRIHAALAYWLRIVLIAAVLSLILLFALVTNLSQYGGFNSGSNQVVPRQIPISLGTYNAHYHNDLCSYRDRPISCSDATATAQANLKATQSGDMCCLH